jgi:hypothetical protein
MGLFKSREERKIERDIAVRKGINAMRRNIKNLERNEKEYLNKARRAKQLGDNKQLTFLKNTLRRTSAQRRLLERQMLSLETALQMKNQAEAMSEFARSLNAVSMAISDAFGSADLEKTQREFTSSVAKAENMEQRMEILLDMNEQMFEAEPTAVDGLISEEEIDLLIEGETGAKEGSAFDEEIAQRLKKLEKELDDK